MPRNDRTSTTTHLGDLIQLPRFDAAGAIWLSDALIAVAGSVPALPGAIQRAKEGLEEDLAALRRAAAARLSAAAAADSAATAAADRNLDACWTALHDWLTAYVKLPEGLHEGGDLQSPALGSFQRGEAYALLTELYPDGLSFILLPFEAEWDQSERRIVSLTGGPLGDRVRALGGEVFLDALRAAHLAYGKALGLPRPPGEKGGGASGVAEALESVVAALRRYALKVTAHVEIGEPQTAELASVLLAPLLHYETRAAQNPR